MEIKQVKQTKVFGKEIKTSLKTIWNHVQVIPDEIMNEMNLKKLSVEGPQVWIYNGADGNPDTVFDLLIGFPVAYDKMDINITALDEFKCATIIHQGDWSKFNVTYNQIIGDVIKNGLHMTGECREVYHQVDFERVENNITEIQIGIR
ncbi:MAG: hypothetical protein A2041_12620 [Bacteroidetes bacterium GWA2_31_9b]|nr:MAG: hypothetical protein A2041_12620 [Bacteroidetes bacterium GWA2_31_9b]